MTILKTVPVKIVPEHTVLEYSKLKDAVQTLLSEREGRKVNIRDYSERYTVAGAVKDVPYQDFWHFWIDSIDNDVSNDTTNTVYWGDVYPSFRNKAVKEGTQWIVSILDAFNEVLLSVYTQEQLDDGIEIEYSW